MDLAERHAGSPGLPRLHFVLDLYDAGAPIAEGNLVAGRFSSERASRVRTLRFPCSTISATPVISSIWAGRSR